MSAEADISWQMLRRIVREWAGDSVELAEVKPLVGGCINTTLGLSTTGGDRAVLKISPHRVDRAYAEEAYQLDLLRSLGLPVPRVWQLRLAELDDPYSYLLIEHMPGMDLTSARAAAPGEQFEQVQQHLAELMRTMHEQRGSVYCRVGDGRVGDRFSSWPAFYRVTFEPIVEEACRSPLLATKQRKAVHKVHERLERLVAHGDCPRLVHWDLWSTNVLAGPDDHGAWRVTAVLDPCCKFAHVEAELAYLDLFHTTTPAFMKAYLRPGEHLDGDYHRCRKHVYQLYFLLNHLCLHGGEHHKLLLTTLDKVGTLV